MAKVLIYEDQDEIIGKGGEVSRNQLVSSLEAKKLEEPHKNCGTQVAERASNQCQAGGIQYLRTDTAQKAVDIQENVPNGFAVSFDISAREPLGMGLKVGPP